jgi:DNA-binding Lrp family transcriptional regulator
MLTVKTYGDFSICSLQSCFWNRKRSSSKLIEFKEVVQADNIFGEYDVIVRMTTDDLDKLEEFVSQSIRTVPNVLVTSTMIISREYKGKTYRPKNN